MMNTQQLIHLPPSVAHFVAPTAFRVWFPRLGRALARGFTLSASFAGSVNLFFRADHWVATRPRCASVVNLPRETHITEGQRTLSCTEDTNYRFSRHTLQGRDQR